MSNVETTYHPGDLVKLTGSDWACIHFGGESALGREVIVSGVCTEQSDIPAPLATTGMSFFYVAGGEAPYYIWRDDDYDYSVTVIEPAIQVGDWVETDYARDEVLSYRDEERFQVTGVHISTEPHTHNSSYYVTGDKGNYGVWSRNVKPDLSKKESPESSEGDEDFVDGLEGLRKAIEEVYESFQALPPIPTLLGEFGEIDEDDLEDTSVTDALRTLQHTIGRGNAIKGFHDDHDAMDMAIADGELDPKWERYMASTLLGLITTEVSEAAEEIRASDRPIWETYYSGGENHFKGLVELDPRDPVDSEGNPRKPEGVPSEIADIVIRAFDFAYRFDIDLASIIFEKLAYNGTRPTKHGKAF